MPRNAIPYFAKAREINEKPLLEKRRERIIEVCERGESRQVRGGLWIFRGKPEKVRHYDITLVNFALQCIRFAGAGFGTPRSPGFDLAPARCLLFSQTNRSRRNVLYRPIF